MTTVTYAYGKLGPMVRFSPWATDDVFLRVQQQVAADTLVDGYRCYELWQLVQESAKLATGALLEVGVWRGGSGCLIARAAREAGIRDTVYLADTFEGLVKQSACDPLRYRNGEFADTSADHVRALAVSLGVPDVVILTGVFPEDTGHTITESLRFVHIDVDFYESARAVFAWVWPRLASGGIVVFDDYGFEGCAGVTQLVESIRQQPDTTVFYNLNGHAVVVKR